MNRLTAKHVDRLTAKLVVVNLVKLHLTKLILQKEIWFFCVNFLFGCHNEWKGWGFRSYCTYIHVAVKMPDL